MKIIYMSLLFFLLSFELYSHDRSIDTTRFTVQFVKTLNGTEDFTENEGFFSKVAGFFLGHDIMKFVKPINLIAFDTNKLIVLDPGLYTPILYDYNERDFILLNEDIKTSMQSLVGITQINDKEVIFSDSELNKIFIYNLKTSNITSLNDSLKLDKPTGIAYLKSKKQIWIAETGNHRLIVTDLKGNILHTFGERGDSTGMFNFPTFIWINNDKDLVYVTDALNYRVQIFTPDFELKSAFGHSGDAAGYFASMKGIAVDTYGHIFVVDAILNAVQVFDIYGNYLYNFGRQGRDLGEFWMPSGIFIDQNNYIYVTDSYNCRVQIFHLIKAQ
jgi:DNA-binding beta-propeller fold protein YncE